MTGFIRMHLDALAMITVYKRRGCFATAEILGRKTFASALAARGGVWYDEKKIAVQLIGHALFNKRWKEVRMPQYAGKTLAGLRGRAGRGSVFIT